MEILRPGHKTKRALSRIGKTNRIKLEPSSSSSSSSPSESALLGTRSPKDTNNP